jgi:hypothetical protein
MNILIGGVYIGVVFNFLFYSVFGLLWLFGMASSINGPALAPIELSGLILVPWLPVGCVYFSSRFDLLKMEEGYSSFSRFVFIVMAGVGSVVSSMALYDLIS